MTLHIGLERPVSTMPVALVIAVLLDLAIPFLSGVRSGYGLDRFAHSCSLLIITLPPIA